MRVLSMPYVVLAAALSFNPGFVTPVAAESVDAKTRAEVTEAAAQAIEDHFFDEARGQAIAQALRNGRRPAHALIPAGEDRFFIEDLPYLRVHVDRSRDGGVEAITVERAGSRPVRIDRSD